jgi:plastocyanin
MNRRRSRFLFGGVLAVPLLLGCGAWALPAAEPAGAVIAGVVRFTGTLPKPQLIHTTDNSTILHSDLVVDSRSKGLQFVAVSLEDAPAQPKADKAAPVVMDQRDMLFIPRVVAAQHGQMVRFENNDLCNHSVMAVSLLPANQFNRFGIPGQPVEHAFEAQNRPVQIGCSLHGWMRAWVYVFPHPWFAVTDAQGKFRIENVPPGEYILWFHHADTNLQQRRKLKVQAGQQLEVNLDWDRPKGP